MTSPADATDDPMTAAFFLAAGRVAPADVPVSAALLACARRLVAHGRTIVSDGPCPSRLVRRAEALFVPRRGRLRAALWSILFDSAAGLAPATRGLATSRMLRIGGDGGALQAEVSGTKGSPRRVVGALEGAPGTAVVVLEPNRGAAVRTTVGDGGAFELPIPKGATSFSLVVKAGRRVVARTPVVEVGRG